MFKEGLVNGNFDRISLLVSSSLSVPRVCLLVVLAAIATQICSTAACERAAIRLL